MRRPSRQIEVFDISLMAVVTKAMGAFLVLFVLVLPYYTSDPDVDTTSTEVHEQLAKMRKELEDLARQVGANPADTGALQAAISRMREALSESNDKIDQLYKEASALSSQLRRTREELQNTQTQLASAEARSQRAQIAEAEMEVTANQALQTRHAALVAEAEMEATANQALRTRRAALIAGAELEQQLNQVSQAQRQTLIAQAEGEEAENELLAVVRHAVLEPKLLLSYLWSTGPECAKTSVMVSSINVNGNTPLDGINLQNLGAEGTAFLRRSGVIGAAFPLGAIKVDQATSALRVSILSNEDELRTLTYASVDPPAPTACHVTLTTTIYNLHLRTSQNLEQADLEVPAGARFTLLTGIDLSHSSSRMSAPSQADQALWDNVKAVLQRNVTPAQKSP
jgi:predicted  nucleic acid-binding Zn-ribbon protein